MSKGGECAGRRLTLPELLVRGYSVGRSTDSKIEQLVLICNCCSRDIYPRQNSLAVALRELGKIDELRQRIHIGLNKGKGEAKNALAGLCCSTAMGVEQNAEHF